MMTISSPSKDDNLGMDNGKYVRYTPEQVEALERLYHDCPKPSSLRRQQLIRECPILSNIEPKQIKVWFQNRRCREKQRKEASRLQAVNRKLTAMNKLLMEENDRLQKQVSHLVYENSYFRQQTQNVTLATTDTSCESVVTSGQHHLTPQHPPKDASPAGLLSIAEETLTEFLSKATGTAVEWVQMPGMKPGPDSIGIIAISHGCSGVASRACGLIGLEPTRVAEILKDWSSWFRDCRAVDTLNVLSTANNGTIELLYMQLYAPTTLAPARDFWLLRYTSPMEDGSLVICERSLNNTQNGPSMPPVPHFVRAEMLPSGYLIRPCEGGGSIIHIVDHVDLEPWSVPEVLRPLYESSTLLAQRTTFAAFSHLRQISQEISQPTVTSWGRRPAALRALGQRMSRGFNEAVNGFADEGWSVTESDGVDDVTVFVNLAPAKATGANQMYAAHGIPVVSNAVLCAKASMLLQDVAPAILMRFLREYRSEWADSSMDAYSAASVKAGPTSLPMARNGSFGSQVILPLAHTLEHEEFMEVVKLENMGHYQDNMMMSPGDIFFLQLCNGVDENAIGTSAELVFAPIDASFTDDAPLLPSGFRIIPINNKLTQNPTRDLASTLEVGVGPPRNQRASNQAGPTKSVMTIAFQFGFEIHLQENISAMARQYVRSIISSVQRVALALSPSPFGSPSLQGNPEAHTLTHWIQQSYSCFLGEELFKSVDERSESVLKTLWNHSDAITCCSVKTLPVFTFANQAGLDMLETTLVSLQDVSLDKIFDENGRKNVFSELPLILQQGYGCLPGGVCLSSMGRPVSYSNLFGSGRDYDSCQESGEEVDSKFSRNYDANGQEIEGFRRVENDGDEIRHPLVKEVCRLIDLRSNWTPNLEGELKQLVRSLKPQQVSAVLRHQKDARIALQLFYWADRQWRYQHHPIVYNSMLEILSKTSMYQGAKRVIRLMSRRRIRLHPEAFGYLMISYSRAGRWRKALQVFSVMEKAKISPNLLVYNIAIYVLVKSNKLEMAMKILDRMKLVEIAPNEVTYNCLIKGYCDAGRIQDAMNLIQAMSLTNCYPDKVCYHTIMGFYCKDNKIEEIRSLMKKMKEGNVIPDQVTYNTLIHMLSKSGYGVSAISFLKEAEQHGFSIDKVEYSAIIHSFCESGDIEKAKELMKEMKMKGCPPDIVTYTDLINGLCRVGKVLEAKTLLQEISKLGCKPNTVSYTSFLNGLCRNGKSSEAREILNTSEDELWVPNSITYSVLMHGFIREGKLPEAHEITREMIRKGFSPTPAEINLLIQSFCQNGRPNDAKKLIQECLEKCEVNEVNFTTLINGFCKNQDLESAFSVLDDMYLKDIKPDVVTYTTIIDTLGKMGLIEKAIEMINKMLAKSLIPTLVTYRVIINRFCQHGRVDELLSLLDKMVLRQPYKNVYNLVIEKLCLFGKVDEAYKLLGKVLRTGSRTDVDSCHMLIESYLKKGDPGSAYKVACWMFERNLVMDLKLSEKLRKILCVYGMSREADEIMLRFVECGKISV